MSNSASSNKVSIQFAPMPKLLTSAEIRNIENYIFESVFIPLKLKQKDFYNFLDFLYGNLEKTIKKGNDLQFTLSEILYNGTHILSKKGNIDKMIKNNGILTFLNFLMIDRLNDQGSKIQDYFYKIKYRNKIVLCNNEYRGCAWKGKFHDWEMHEKTCEFSSEGNKLIRCRCDLEAGLEHEINCPIRVIFTFAVKYYLGQKKNC
jgi:hypothetical protein